MATVIRLETPYTGVRIQHIIIEEKKVIMLCLYIIISGNAHPGVFNRSSKEGRKSLVDNDPEAIIHTFFIFLPCSLSVMSQRMGGKRHI